MALAQQLPVLQTQMPLTHLVRMFPALGLAEAVAVVVAQAQIRSVVLLVLASVPPLVIVVLSSSELPIALLVVLTADLVLVVPRELLVVLLVVHLQRADVVDSTSLVGE